MVTWCGKAHSVIRGNGLYFCKQSIEIVNVCLFQIYVKFVNPRMHKNVSETRKIILNITYSVLGTRVAGSRMVHVFVETVIVLCM